MTDRPIIVEVERIRCGHNSRIGSARVADGEPYVLAHHTASDFAELSRSLAETGHGFSVRVVDRRVSMLEWAAINEDFDRPAANDLDGCCGEPPETEDDRRDGARSPERERGWPAD